MYFAWVVLEYTCPNGHANTLNKYYSSSSPVSEDSINSRLPRVLPCSQCKPDSISLPQSPASAKVTGRVQALTEEQFLDLGVTAESLDKPKQDSSQ
jgi:hypothetical protein